MRILVLRGGALGDFLVTLPALGLLRSRWPHARIELVGNADAAGLAVNRHYLDAAHSHHDVRWSRLGNGTIHEEDMLGQWLRSFNLVINFWPDNDGAIAADFSRLGFRGLTAPDITTDDRILISSVALPTIAPAAAHFCAALAPLGLRTHDLAAPVHRLPEDEHEAESILGQQTDHTTYVAWHPGSGSPSKNWPLERWRTVIATLSQRHRLRVIALIGEAERTWIDSGSLPENSIVIGGVKKSTLAALLARASLFLGHDSGPSHIAAAVGCPCVLVFGPTDPAMWAPPYPHVRARRGGGRVDDVSVADVVDAAGDLLVARS